MLQTLKGAIFDMDGTLIDSLGLWEIMWEAIGKQCLGKEGFRPSEEDDKAIRTMALKEGMEMIHQNYRIGANGAELLELSNRIIRDFYANEVQLKPGVREFLEYCRSHGIKMCVATATGPKLVATAMEHCGIGHYFADVLSCAKIGKGKDEPDIFLAALEVLGTAKEETCVFEDSAVAIATAARAGFKTVAIYDKCNYGQEEMRKTADEYIDEGETLLRLIKE